jgi:hypothetical protein
MLTFIIEMDNTQASDTTPPFRDRYVGEIQLDTLDKIKVSMCLQYAMGHWNPVTRRWHYARIIMKPLWCAERSVCHRTESIRPNNRKGTKVILQPASQIEKALAKMLPD